MAIAQQYPGLAMLAKQFRFPLIDALQEDPSISDSDLACSAWGIRETTKHLSICHICQNQPKSQRIKNRTRAAMQSAAAAYAADRVAGQEAMMFAGQNADVRQLNEFARDNLKAAGLIAGPEIDIDKLKVAAGDRLIVTKNERGLGVKNGQLFDVKSIENGKIAMKEVGGCREITLASPAEAEGRAEAMQMKLNRAEAIKGEVEEKLAVVKDYIKRQQGTAEWREKGELAEKLRPAYVERDKCIRSLKACQQEIRDMRAGIKTAKAEAAVAVSLAYGHAVTIHKSQGATIKQVAGKGGNGYSFARDSHMNNLQSAYVAASRNEGQFHVHLSRAHDAAVVEQQSKLRQVESLKDYRIKQPAAAKDNDLAAATRRASNEARKQHEQQARGPAREHRQEDLGRERMLER